MISQQNYPRPHAIAKFCVVWYNCNNNTMHCGFRVNKDEVMKMDFQAYLATSDEECSNDEEWVTTAEGNKTLFEEEKISNHWVWYREPSQMLACTY